MKGDMGLPMRRPRPTGSATGSAQPLDGRLVRLGPPPSPGGIDSNAEKATYRANLTDRQEPTKHST
jgi:hypothetical protein